MREILFRGKTKNRRDIAWIEGSLMRCIHMFDKEPTLYIYGFDTEVDGRGCIIDNYCGEEVIPETVGQFTGLFDKNGIAIFEGDIVKLDNSLDTKQKNFEVRFAYGQFYIGINQPVSYIRDSCEVIGNIHDNPELLEVSK